MTDLAFGMAEGRDDVGSIVHVLHAWGVDS